MSLRRPFKVGLEFTPRATERLCTLAPDIAQLFLNRIEKLRRHLESGMKQDGTPTPANSFDRTAPVDIDRRYCRTFHKRGTLTDYVTFKWPVVLPPTPVPKDFGYMLRIVSVGNWDEKFMAFIRRPNLGKGPKWRI